MRKKFKLKTKAKWILFRWLIKCGALQMSPCYLPKDNIVLEAAEDLAQRAFLNHAEIDEYVAALLKDFDDIEYSKSRLRKMRQQALESTPEALEEKRQADEARKLRRQRKLERKAQRKMRAQFTPKRPRFDQAYSADAYRQLLNSDDWKRLRYATLRRYGGQCKCCGQSAKNGVVIHVDHIVAASVDWSRRLDPENVQPLCEPCNIGKSNFYSDDWR